MRLVIDQAGAPKLTKSHAEFQKFLCGDTPESGEGHTPRTQPHVGPQGLRRCEPPVLQRWRFTTPVVPLLAIKNTVTLVIMDRSPIDIKNLFWLRFTGMMAK